MEFSEASAAAPAIEIDCEAVLAGVKFESSIDEIEVMGLCNVNVGNSESAHP